MKIAVISDIHGNMPALQKVTADIEQWQPDQVIVGGDIVNRGPLSLNCLHFILHKQAQCGWVPIRGNHEDYLLECADPSSPRSGPEYEINMFAHWAYTQLNGEVAALRSMPEQYSVMAPDGAELRVVHASMRHNRDGIYPKTNDAELRKQIAPAPAVFVTGHTHRPLLRRIDETLVVNVGSVGAPFDDDHRLSYGRFLWTAAHGWQAEIVRLAYDWRQTERDYVSSGFLAEAGPLAQLMLVELRRSGGLIYRWASRYQEAVLRQEISMEESVRRVMQDEDLRPYIGPPGWELEGR